MRYPYLVSLSPLHPNIPRTCMITSICFHDLRIYSNSQIISSSHVLPRLGKIIRIIRLDKSGYSHYFESVFHSSVKIPGGKIELGPKDIPQ